MFKLIKDIIAPKKCYSCQKEWHFLCDKCILKIDRFRSTCYVCKHSSDNFEIHEKCKKNVYFDKLIIFSHYKDNIIKNLIKKSKFYSWKDILEDLWEYLSDSLILNKKLKNKWEYTIVSVPMYFLRRFKRWYNHSDILAKQVSKESWIIYNKKIIKRIKNTFQQSKLSKKERERNLKLSFKFHNKYLSDIKNKRIILVDDVVSTWTTLNEISKLLKIAWAKEVVALVVASD